MRRALGSPRPVAVKLTAGRSTPPRRAHRSSPAESGRFWFFSPDNVESALKRLDGTSINGHPWFFWGALSDLEVSRTQRDQNTGVVEAVHEPGRQTCGGARFDLF